MSWDKEPPKKEEIEVARMGSWADAPPDREIGNMESLQRGAEQGLTLGFSDEIQGGIEAVGRVAGIKGLGANSFSELGLETPSGFDIEKFKENYRDRRDNERKNLKEVQKANPYAYGTGEFGGAVATSLIPGVGAAGSVARMAGTGAALGGVSALGNSEADTFSGMAGDTAKGAVIGGAFGLGAGALQKGAGKLIDKGISKAAPVIKEYVEAQGTLKPNAKEIQAAAERLGVKATPGMLYDGKHMQGLESQLSQSPSLFGWLVNKNTSKVTDALDEVPKKVLKDASNLSPFELGETVKGGIRKQVSEKAKLLGTPFREVAESTSDMAPNAKDLERFAKGLSRIDNVRLRPDSPWASEAASFAKAAQNAKSVDELKALRTMAQEEARGSEGVKRAVLSDIADRLGRLEQKSIMRNSVETMRGFAKNPAKGKEAEKLALQGEEIGKGLVSQLKGARKDWRSFMQDLNEVAGNANLGRLKGPQSFTSAVDDIRSERVTEKLFNPGDLATLKSMQSKFPEQAELLRQGRLGVIDRASRDNLGNYSRNKFFGQVGKLPDDAAQALFKPENMSTFKDARMLTNELPDLVGKSDTPRGMAYFGGVFNPALYAKDASNYMAYKGIQSGAAQKLADTLIKSPKMQELAVKNPQAYKALVIDLSSRMGSPGRIIPAAAENKTPSELDKDSSVPSQYPVPEEEARKRFIEGN